jgi:hypothetical protein
MERRIRPIGDAVHMAVLHRIPMDVIEMPVEILLIAKRVFPKTPLPYRAFPVLGLGSADPHGAPE